ncbi:MAG: class B sortase [Oscillospiraceae bacterium]|nr:class B sortase [Oscillospiraceae bacterium]
MKSRTKKILVIVSALSALMAALCICKIAMAQRQYKESKQEYEDLKGAVITTVPSNESEDEESPYLVLDFDRLSEINTDFKFLIDSPGTDVSYTDFQSSDTDFYLRRTFEGSSNVGGVIFIDYRSGGDLTGRNTVIYGHRMNDGSMFAGLAEYMSAEYYAGHDTIHIYTEDAVLEYTVFSASEVTTGCDCFTFAFQSDYEFHEWLSRQAYRSAYDTGIVPNSTDRVITLVTCTGQEEWRYVVQAVLTETVFNDVD